jgi:hypothetical protein
MKQNALWTALFSLADAGNKFILGGKYYERKGYEAHESKQEGFSHL